MAHPKEILLTAFACDPNYGSEKGIGWLAVKAAARKYRAHVITPPENKAPICAAPERPERAQFHYVDLPSWLQPLRDRSPQLYYLCWQWVAYRAARQLVAERSIALIHHVTYGNCWTPSPHGYLDVSFVWNAGGRAKTPLAFLSSLSPAGRRWERLRNALLSASAPIVQHVTASRAALIHTCSKRSQWPDGLPVRRFILGGLSEEEIRELSPNRPEAGKSGSSDDRTPFRAISIGRLLPWKGFDLGIRAFARFREHIPEAEYWIIGDGPEQNYLKHLGTELGCGDAIRFWGRLPRDETLDLLGDADVLIHPSLHEQFGYVLLEAMATGTPPICLDLEGSPKVVGEGGIVLQANDPDQVVADLTEELRRLESNTKYWEKRSRRACSRARDWTHETVGDRLLDLYDQILEEYS
jgi:glycosyltransferase involved in cell wall biosynthesis